MNQVFLRSPTSFTLPFRLERENFGPARSGRSYPEGTPRRGRFAGVASARAVLAKDASERTQTSVAPRPRSGRRELHALKQTLRKLDLYTVCEEARCPNVGECWAAGTATIMLLGHTCTRGCRFCAVTTGNPRGAFDPREPEHVARAIAELGLKYVVLTMVDRDDLLDGGAAHVARTVTRAPRALPGAPDRDAGRRFPRAPRRRRRPVLEAAPDVFAHNVEVVRRLTPRIRDARCELRRVARACSRTRSAARPSAS